MTYDETIQVGDLIRAYHKGIWRVTQIERRFYTDYYARVYGKTVGEEYNPLFYYEKVLNDALTPASGERNKSCDAAFCSRVDEESIKAELSGIVRKYSEAFRILFGKELNISDVVDDES